MFKFRTMFKLAILAVAGFVAAKAYETSQRRYPLGNTEPPKGDN